MRELEHAVLAVCNADNLAGRGDTGDRFEVTEQDVRVAILDARREALGAAAAACRGLETAALRGDGGFPDGEDCAAAVEALAAGLPPC